MTKIHPDKYQAQGANEVFAKFKDAFDVLIDPESRTLYDEELLEISTNWCKIKYALSIKIGEKISQLSNKMLFDIDYNSKP